MNVHARRLKSSLLLLGGFFFLGAISHLAAQSDVSSLWIGGSDDWATDGDWNNTPSSLNYPNNGNGGLTYDASITTGNPTVSGDITINTLSLDSATISVDSGITLTALTGFDWTSGSLNGSGTINFNGGTLTTAGQTINTINLVSAGTTSITGTSSVTFYNGSTWRNNGTINLTDDGNLIGGSGGGIIINSGTFEKTGSTGSGTSEVSIALTNTFGGLIENNTSGQVMDFTALADNSGTIATGSGGQINFDRGLNLHDGSSITGSGIVEIGDGVTADGTTTVGSCSTILFTGGYWGGTSTVSGGTVHWTGGGFSGNGLTTTTLDGSTTFVIDANGSETINAQNLVTDGLTTITGTSSVTFYNGSTWRNNGTINLTDDGNLIGGSGGGIIINSGTFEKTGSTGSGTSEVSIALTNTFGGLIENNTSGQVVDFTALADNSGTIATGSGGQINFDRGLNLHDGSTITGSGIVEIGDGVTADGTTTVGSCSTILFTGGYWGGTSTVSGGTVHWTGGGFYGYGNPENTTTLDAGTTFLIDANGSETINAQNLVTDGLTTITGTSSITFYNGSTWRNNGTINLTDDGNLINGSGGGSLTNSGTFEKTGSSGDGTSTVSIALTNTFGGLITVETGTLDVTGVGANSGQVHVDSGTQISFNGGLDLHDGSTITGSGIVEIGDGVTADGTTTVGSCSTILFTGGSWGGTSTVSGGTVHWTGGGFYGYGNPENTTTLDAGTTFVIDANGSETINAQNLVTDGLTTITGTSSVTFENGATWTNNGTVNLTDDGNLINGSGGGSLTNSGTFEKTGSSGDGTSTVSIALTNTFGGLITVETGTLNVTGVGANSGQVHVDSGTQISFNGGLDLHDGSSITGSGIVEIGDGVTADGTTTLGSCSTILFSGGSWGGTSTVSGGTVHWTGGGFYGYGNPENTTTLDAGTTFVIDANGSETINAQNLVTDGLTTITGTSSVTFENGATWTNNGTINLADDGNLIDGSGGGSLTNSGTFEKTGGSGTSTVSVAFDNAGTVQVDSGNLAFTGGFTQTAAGAIIGAGTLTSDVSTVNNGTNLTVAGTIVGNVSVGSGTSFGGSGTVNGTITVASGGSTYPGDPHILTASSIDYQEGSTAQFAIDTSSGSSHPPAPGVDYDQIQLTGEAANVLAIEGTSTLQLNFTAASLAALQANAESGITDNYFLFTLGDGGSSGQFTDLTLTEGCNTYTETIIDGDATFAQLNLIFDLSYTGDSGNDTMSGGNDVGFSVFAVVPEPSDWAPLITLLLALACWQRRRGSLRVSAIKR